MTVETDVWQKLDTISGFGILIVLFFSTFFVYRQLKSDHDWNRRITAQNALRQDGINDQVRRLNDAFDLYEQKNSISLDELKKKINLERDSPDTHLNSLKIDLHQLLNHYESLSRGINQGIYDAQVIKAGRKTIMMRHFKIFEEYIHYRQEYFNPHAWHEFEMLVNDWRAQDVQSRRKNDSRNQVDKWLFGRNGK